MVQQAAERYMTEHPGARIVVGAGGTYRGYKSLLDGTIDIAMASGPPSDETMSLRSQDSPQFITTSVGRVAMVPIAHPDSPLRDLSTHQLRDIFSGRIDNMKQLGGKDLPIKVLIGPPADGLTESWRTILFGDGDHYTPKAAIFSAKERVERARVDPAIITFVATGDLDGSVKPLTVNGANAEEQNIRQGNYELVAPLMLVTTEHASVTAKDFVRYFLSVSKDLHLPGFIAPGADASPSVPKP